MLMNKKTEIWVEKSGKKIEEYDYFDYSDWSSLNEKRNIYEKFQKVNSNEMELFIAIII